ncbi:unnamed protein product [Durusdinium trenchii]|uniref:Uncharacterized protein n=1 Tax=Durusdinium trenchii TaxID=1381693 RepID=A0ABP0LZD1_9DINO
MPGTIHDPVGGQSRATIAAKQAKPLEDFAERTKKEAEERRKTRDAEGGRGGGFNDRQQIERRVSVEDDVGYDEFGRRKTKAGAAAAGSKAERAAAALERLKQKRKVETSEGSVRSRSRSASPGRRARVPKPPHAGFRPRGANHRF